MSYLDDLIERLNKIPSETQSYLRKIRDLDKKVQEYKAEMDEEKIQFFKVLEIWQNKKGTKDKDKADELYCSIMKKDKKIHDFSRQKVLLAEKLYNLVHQPTQRLDKELHSRTRERNKNNVESFSKKKKCRRSKQSFMKERWDYQPFQPCYCFCGKPSFGQMVMCENSYCDKQWFHVECIDQKINSNEKWYCKQCRKGRDKPRFWNVNGKS